MGLRLSGKVRSGGSRYASEPEDTELFTSLPRGRGVGRGPGEGGAADDRDPPASSAQCVGMVLRPGITRAAPQESLISPAQNQATHPERWDSDHLGNRSIGNGDGFDRLIEFHSTSNELSRWTRTKLTARPVSPPESPSDRQCFVGPAVLSDGMWSMAHRDNVRSRPPRSSPAAARLYSTLGDTC